MRVNPILLGVTIAVVVGVGLLYLAERRNAKPRPPYPTADEWNWDDWQDAE